MTQTILGWKGFIWLLCPNHHSPLKEAKVQAGQELQQDTEGRNSSRGPRLMLWAGSLPQACSVGFLYHLG